VAQHRWARGIAVVSALALLAGACGDDEDTESAGTTAAAAETTATAAETTAAAAETSAATTAGGAATTTAGAATTAGAPTKSEIKIGMAVGETGGSGSTQKFASPVAKAWAEYVNAELGGINGHPVNLIVKDTKSEAATGAAVVRELVESENVVTVLTADASSEAAYAPYTAEQNVPVIGVGYSVEAWSKLPNWFSTTTTAPAVVQEQFVAAKAVEATNFAAIACVEVASCAASEPLYAPSAEAVDIGYVGLIPASTTAPNYTAECLQFIQENADYIQFSIAPAAGVKIAGDCRSQGYEGWFGASAGAMVASNFSDPELRMAGGLNGFPWFVDDEPVAEFRRIMELYAPDAEYTDPTSTSVWAALELFRTAMAGASDEPTRDEVFEAY